MSAPADGVAPIPDRYNASTTFLDDNLSAGRSEAPAIRCDGANLTYRQVHAAACRMGLALQALGLQRGQRVCLLLPDSPELVAAFFGGIRIGAVPVALNTRLGPAGYRYLIDDSQARILVAHHELMPRIRSIRADLSRLDHVVIVGAARAPAEGDELGYAELVARQPDRLEAAATDRRDPAFWLYSSGSTGAPKPVVHRHQDMRLCADLYARGVLGLESRDRTFSAAKLFFAYGLGNGLYFPFRVGATTILHPGAPRPDDVFRLIERERPTLFFGVPTLYAAMLQVAHPGNLSSLRLCVSAGEALPAELYRQWRQRFGVEILDGIGSTEMLHIYLSNRPGRVVPGSSGTPVPGYDVKILDEDEAPVPDGRVGNLWVRGESCSPGYWNRTAATERAWRDGWFFSGDKYYRDGDGIYWFCGRADDMLKVKGLWVSPIEVEHALVEHPAVAEAAVVARTDVDGLVKPQAYVVPAAGCEDTKTLAAELSAFAEGALPSHKRPRWIALVSELPKTTTGKIQRFRLRDLS